MNQKKIILLLSVILFTSFNTLAHSKDVQKITDSKSIIFF